LILFGIFFLTEYSFLLFSYDGLSFTRENISFHGGMIVIDRTMKLGRLLTKLFAIKHSYFEIHRGANVSRFNEM